MMTTTLPDINALWDFQHPAVSEAAFREVLPQAEAAGETAYQAELLTQIARALGLQRKFEEASETLHEAEKLCGSDPNRAMVRVALERGRVQNSSGNPGDARPYFEQAMTMASDLGEEFLAIDAAHMLAIVASGDEALTWNLRALDMSKAASDDRAVGWQGSLYNNIGWTYHDLGKYEDALSYFQAGLDFQLARNRDWEARVASWTVGRCLRSLGRPEEALAIQQGNLRKAEAAGSSVGFIEEELGECLLLLGRNDEARPHFAQAYAELSQDPWLAENESDRLARLQELGKSGESAN
jgi:tetratricopeptide (TPR) repeat protein